MKTKSSRKGVALILVLITAMIVFILGVSITGLTTQEGRSSLQRSNEILTRQTALAGIKYAQNLLMQDWDNPEIPSPGGKLIDNEYYSENGCYYTVVVEQHTPEQCIFKARAYFKEASTGNRELWAKGIEATYCRSSYSFALLGLGKPTKKWKWDEDEGYCYVNVYPKSLSIVDAVIDGKIGTAQKYGDITVEPRPCMKKMTILSTQGGKPNTGTGTGTGTGIGTGTGTGTGTGLNNVMGVEVEKVQEVELSIQNDAELDMPNIPKFVKVMKEKNTIAEPIQIPDPHFRDNNSETEYNTGIQQPPGFYRSLNACTSSLPVTVGGSGKYRIKDCYISSNGNGNVKFNAGGTYYIEEMTVRGAGTLTLSSGNYYVKRLKLGNPAGEKPLTLKVEVVKKKPVNIIVTEEMELTGININPAVKMKEGEDPVSNPGNLIIVGTDTCEKNKITSVSGSFVFQNKSNVIDIKNSSVDGSLIGNVLNIEGNGQFSCHKEVMSDQTVLTKWEEQ